MSYTPEQVRAALEFAKGVGLMPRSHFDVLTWLSENYARMAADAERYRWLRDLPPGMYECLAVCGPEEAHFGEQLDLRIDAAMNRDPVYRRRASP